MGKGLGWREPPRRRSALRTAAQGELLEPRTLLAAYTGTAGADDYLIRPGSGGAVEILFNNSLIDTQPAGSALTFNLAAGNDTLTVAASVSAAITMNGQGGIDALNLQSDLATVAFIANPAASSAEDNITASAGSLAFSGTIDLLSLNLSGSATASLPAAGAHTLYCGALTIAPNAKLDLNDNDLVVTASPFTTVQSWVSTGRAGATGITSTAGSAAGGSYCHSLQESGLTGFTQWPPNSGHTISGSAIIVHYEIFGDVNVDHLVSGDDYTVVDSHLNTTPAPGAAWINGDANTDGSVTGDDYTTIDSNLGSRCTTGPTASLSSPAPSSTLKGSVTLSASAADINGVAGVTFLADGVTLGPEDTTSPYSITWNTTSATLGSHALTLQARDLVGNITLTAPVNVFVDNSVPIQHVQHTANGFEFNTTSLALAFPSANTAGNLLIVTGTAARPAQNLTISDTQGNTYFTALGPISDPNQQVNAYIWYCPSAKAGANTVTIRPTDGQGHAMEIHLSEWSGAHKTSPLDQATFLTGFGTLATSGPITPTQNGELVFGYTFLDQSATVGPGFTPLTLINGDLDAYQIQTAPTTAQATFTQNSDDWLVLAATFKAEFADAIPPTAPSNLVATGSVGSASLTWTGSTDNIAVAGYNIYRSTTSGFTPGAGNLVGQSATNSFTDTGVPAGAHYYRVIARDSALNLSPPSNEASATVTADTTPPSVNITAPASGATLSGSLSVSATAGDNVAVAGVQFYLDGVTLGAEDTTAPYSSNWNTIGAANGAHTLTAIARDGSGNTAASAPVNVTVANTALPGLVLALGFNENAGTTVSDTSAFSNNGTISGASWSASGKYGAALSFDGINDLVTVADSNSLDLTTGMTLEAWVNPSTINSWETVILKETTGEMCYALYADNNGNDSGQPRRPAAYIRQSTTSYTTAGNIQLATNTWTHLAATYDGANLRIYINGVLATTLARTGAINTSTGPLRIGGNSIWGEYFNGLIDEVRIYNRALSATEIQSDMTTAI